MTIKELNRWFALEVGKVRPAKFWAKLLKKPTCRPCYRSVGASRRRGGPRA